MARSASRRPASAGKLDGGESPIELDSCGVSRLPRLPSRQRTSSLPPVQARKARAPESSRHTQAKVQQRQSTQNATSAPAPKATSASGDSRPRVRSTSVRRAASLKDDTLSQAQLKVPLRNGLSELEDWKKRRGYALEARLFSIHGAFPGIRKALLERGWVENDDAASSLWNFKYALMQRDLGDIDKLDDSQTVNFFGRNGEIAAKVSLLNNLYNCSHFDRVDVDSFLPRCYDLTNPVHVDNLVADYKATKSLCLIRRFVQDGGRTKEGGGIAAFPRSVVAVALAVCRRRCMSVDDQLDHPLRPLVNDEDWQVLEEWSLKKPGYPLKTKAARLRPQNNAGTEGTSVTSVTVEASSIDGHSSCDFAAAKEDQQAVADDDAASDAEAVGTPATVAASSEQPLARSEEDEALYNEARGVLEDDFWKHPQRGLDGVQNIWVLKPAGKSRGRGIQLTALLDTILEVGVGRGAEARWIAQKYMENPMIINGKKFDIRQWVVVTRWNPLSVWFYEDCYLRFSFADYNPQKLKNKYAHLTNNSISKKAVDFEEQKDDTMWHSDDFSEHLRCLGFTKHGEPIEDPWASIVQPKIEEIVYRSLESVQEVMQPRTNSFQLFGYDFMVSDDLETWLIEVNSSPDLSYSTSTTRILVKAMLDDLIKVVVDVERFGMGADRPKRKWEKCSLDTGRFRLLQPARRRREEKFGKARAEAQRLAVHGKALQLRKPRKGECPNGPDMPADPRFDAAEIFAAMNTDADERGAVDGTAPESEDEDELDE